MDNHKKILYIEDNEVFGITLKLLTEEIGHDCQIATQYEEAIQKFYDYQPDLLIVDINLGSTKSGIDLVKEISTDLATPFIYLTYELSDEVFEEATSTNPTTFLNKPVSKINLRRAIELCLHKNNRSWGDLFPESYFVKGGRELTRINLADTYYIEVQDKYCTVHTSEGSHLIRIQLKKLIELLPENFFQIHRSFVINLHFLKSINPTQRDVLVHVIKLPIGRRYYDELKTKFQKI